MRVFHGHIQRSIFFAWIDNAVSIWRGAGNTATATQRKTPTCIGPFR
jgi:hypothetical protein